MNKSISILTFLATVTIIPLPASAVKNGPPPGYFTDGSQFYNETCVASYVTHVIDSNRGCFRHGCVFTNTESDARDHQTMSRFEFRWRDGSQRYLINGGDSETTSSDFKVNGKDFLATKSSVEVALETASWDAQTRSLHVKSVGRAISSDDGSDMVSSQFEQNFSNTFKTLDDVIVVGLDSNLTASCRTEDVVTHGKNGTDQYTSTLLKSCPLDDSGNMSMLSDKLKCIDLYAKSASGVRLPPRYEPLESVIAKFDQQFAKSLAAKLPSRLVRHQSHPRTVKPNWRRTIMRGKRATSCGTRWFRTI